MKGTKIVITEELDFKVREAYRTLRTNVEFCGDDVKVISVTSCTPNEGKSEVSFQLALVMAEAGKKVLYIDADLRKSNFMKRYHIRSAVRGLSHYLSGQTPQADAIYATGIQNLHVVFAGPIPPNPSELLGNKYFSSLIQNARETYDYILIDTPPLGSVIDAAVVARECDGSIMIVKSNTHSYKLVQNVKKQLEKSGCRILGVVLNQIDTNKKGYYAKYYSRYYGGQQYSEDYGYAAVNTEKITKKARADDENDEDNTY